MRLIALTLLGWFALAVSASASAEPMMSNAEAAFEEYARSNCSSEATALDAYVMPNFWAGRSRLGDEPWQFEWPLNEAEKKGGAHSLAHGSFLGVFAVFTGLLESCGTEVAETECESLEDLQTQTSAGLELSKCLRPTTDELGRIRDEEWRNSASGAIRETVCGRLAESAEQVLALSLERDDLGDTAEEIFKTLWGSCEEES